MKNVVEGGETIKPADLKSILIDAALSENPSIPRGITAIDLGGIGLEAEGILQRTLQDPQKRERGKTAYVTNEKKLILPVNDLVGSNSITFTKSVGYKLESEFIPKRLSQDRFIACDIHSHKDIDTPHSPSDLSALFFPITDPFVTPLCFVITVKRKILVFRGSNTPQWSMDTIDQKKASWTDQVKERIYAFLNPTTSLKEQREINSRACGAMLNQIARKYDLTIYSCPVNRNIATVQTT